MNAVLSSAHHSRNELKDLSRLVLVAVVLRSRDHVGKGRLGLLPLAGLKPAVGVDPELVRLEVLEHLGDAVLDLLLGRDTWRVDVVDT